MFGRRSLLPAVAVALALTSCGAPPPPAAEHAASAAAHAQPPEERRCGLVKRAERTWVGFAEGMTLDDMVPAGTAAASIVRALDVALCAMQRGQVLAVLTAQRDRLQTSAADGGKLEVTKVLWQDVRLTRAEVEIQGLLPEGAAWRANVVRREQAWQIESFASL